MTSLSAMSCSSTILSSPVSSSASSSPASSSSSSSSSRVVRVHFDAKSLTLVKTKSSSVFTTLVTQDARLLNTHYLDVTLPQNIYNSSSSSSSDAHLIALKQELATLFVSLPPYSQRLIPITSIDELSTIPVLLLTSRPHREASSVLVIKTYAMAESAPIYTLQVAQDDTILDCKFLLSSIVKVDASCLRLYYFPPNSRSRAPLLNSMTLKALSLPQAAGTKNESLRVLFEIPSADPAHGAVHRSRVTLLETFDSKVRTVAHLWRRAAIMHAQSRFLGTRQFKVIKPNPTSSSATTTSSSSATSSSAASHTTSSPTKYIRTHYEWLTYAQANERIQSIAAGFQALGLQRGDSVGIMSINRAEWLITDFACAISSLTSVPLYDTLGEEAVNFIFNHAAVKLVVIARQQLASLLHARANCPSLKYIVLMDDQLPDKDFVTSSASSSPTSIPFTHTFSQLENLGKGRVLQVNNDISPSPQDMYSICYTSGTTGQPKGAILSHKSVIAAATNATESLPSYLLNAQDVTFSYLPLAHIYERAIVIACVVNGVAVGFSQGDNTKLVEDVAELKPSIFPGVPRVWQRMYDRIQAQVQSSNIITRTLFQHALATKQEMLQQGQDEVNTLYDRLVFKSVAAKFGGNLRLMFSGAAPISPTVAEFVHIAFQAQMLEGYGLTETNAGMTTTPLDSPSYGRNTGVPVGAVEIKLVNVPDMNYLHTDLPFSRGEIWVRGHSVFSGYYRQEAQTNDVMTRDGWFQTGDIGQWMEDGTLKIIDRKKNLFKLSQGEYIRPELIEGVYKQSPYIATAFVHGESSQNYLVALIIPDWESIFALEQFKGTHDKEKLCQDPRLMKLVLNSMNDLNKSEKLKGFEQVKRIALLAEDFSPDNGLMTPTFKVKRQAVVAKYKDVLSQLYSASSPLTSKL